MGWERAFDTKSRASAFRSAAAVTAFAALTIAQTPLAQASGADCLPQLHLVQSADRRPARAASPAADEPAIYLTPAEIEEIREGSACKRFVRQILALKKKLSETGLKTNFYDIDIIPNNELVKGKKGTYYTVYLKDARRRRRLQFPDARYVLRRTRRLRASLSKFVRDVVAPLQSGVRYTLYVRGRASARTMRPRRQVRRQRFDQVTYLPETSADVYDANQTRTVEIGRRYDNETLPFLRAAFLQKTVADLIPFAAPKILESKVSDSRARREQFAELLLFVEWK